MAYPAHVLRSVLHHPGIVFFSARFFDGRTARLVFMACAFYYHFSDQGGQRQTEESSSPVQRQRVADADIVLARTKHTRAGNIITRFFSGSRAEHACTGAFYLDKPSGFPGFGGLSQYVA